MSTTAKDQDDDFDVLKEIVVPRICTTGSVAGAEREKLDRFSQNALATGAQTVPMPEVPQGKSYPQGFQGPEEDAVVTTGPDTAEDNDDDDLEILKIVQGRMRNQAVDYALLLEADPATKSGTTPEDTVNRQEQATSEMILFSKMSPFPSSEKIRPSHDHTSSEMPTEAPRLRQQQNVARNRISVPGAFAHGSSGVEDGSNQSLMNENDLISQDHHPTEPQVDNSGLAVANAVDEESPSDLPQARESSAAVESAKQREEQAKRFKTKILLGVIGLIVVVLILVALLVPDKDSTQTVAPTTGAPSSSPSKAPTAYDGYLLSLFPIETQTAIETTNSSQARAFEWLVEDIEYLPNPTDSRIIQRFILATLYFSTNGEEWRNKENWLNHSVHECDWATNPDFALKDFISQLYAGYLKDFWEEGEVPAACDKDGNYQHLWLDANKLVGTLPDELYMLTRLQTLSTGMDDGMYGTISTDIQKLTSLQGLAIYGLPDAKSIPTELGLLTDLRFLSLNGNNHQGSIPTELWQLTKLDTLDLGQSPLLQGTIPSVIGEFKDLRWLILENCDITGVIPTEIGQATSLEWLVLYENRLFGSLPSEIGQLSKLQLMLAYETVLTGTLPTEMGLLSSIYMLHLRDNQITGNLPSQMGLLTTLAVALNLKNNRILGALPTQLGLLTRLAEMEFQNNQLVGGIPSQLGQLTNLAHLTFANNSLSGTVPDELSALQPSLHTLTLEGNPFLSGIVPEALCAINGTCVANSLDACKGNYGLSLDCTSLLCGCECTCASG